MDIAQADGRTIKQVSTQMVGDDYPSIAKAVDQRLAELGNNDKDERIDTALAGAGFDSLTDAIKQPANVLEVYPGGKYTSVQAAVDAAVAGSSVSIAPGIFTENVDLKSGIDITGTGINCILDGNLVIRAGATAHNIYITAGNSVVFEGIEYKSDGQLIDDILRYEIVSGGSSGAALQAALNKPGVKNVWLEDGTVTQTNGLIVPVGVNLHGSRGAIIDGNVTVSNYNQLRGIVVTGTITSKTAIKIALVPSTSVPTSNAMYTTIAGILTKLGVTSEEAHIHTDGTIQPGSEGTAHNAAYENSLNGVICMADGYDSTHKPALSIKHKYPIMAMSKGSCQGQADLDNGMATTGEVNWCYNLMQTLWVDSDGVERDGPVVVGGRVALKDAAKAINKLLYTKCNGTEYHFMWQRATTTNIFVGAASASQVNALDTYMVMLGVYIHALGKDDYVKSLPIYVTLDDANMGNSADCVKACTDLLSKYNGVMVSAWGTSALVEDLAGISPSEPIANEYQVFPETQYPGVLQAYKDALPVIPQIIHDHINMTNALVAPHTIDEIESLYLAQRDIAREVTGMPISILYGKFAQFSGNRLSDIAATAFARQGLRVMRATTIPGGSNRTESTLYTFTDSNGVKYKILNSSNPATFGECTFGAGDNLLACTNGGISFHNHLYKSSYPYMHGPQISTTNKGGLAFTQNSNYSLPSGAVIIVNGVTYTVVASGATGNQINVSANVDTAQGQTDDINALAALLTTNLDGIATVSVVTIATRPAIAITPVDPDAEIDIQCNALAASRLFALPCKKYNVAEELIKRNVTSVIDIAPCFHCANKIDWNSGN